ncbi:Homeobox domain-containing protein [Pseudozyma hubeiensis]|nr:Homeobox domain-containing protein [Pseudozyma hubeiensis]
MTSGDAHHSMSEMPASAGGIARHRYTSSATSLPALSPTGALGGHISSSHMGSTASSYGHMTGGASDHYHGYAARPASMSLSTQQPYGYQAAHQHASGMAGSLAYPSSVSAPLTSPGLVYGSSSSSSQLSGGGYDAYPQPSFSSQYVSYLPPSLHDSRFYPLNPFEIKHRRRTTKTQFRVLESTFREVPKPNATLRKQISAQLDMPVRAVQIWFQNRRAKAKAMEKKRTGGGGSGAAAQGGGGGGSGDGEVGVAGSSAVGERARVQSSGMTGGGHPGYSEAGEQRYYDEGSRGAAGGSASAGFDHGINRPTSRSMDLPPLRNVDQLRSGDNYTITSSSTTAPALPPIESRDRRPPSLASSMTMHPASTLSLASGSTGGASSHATYSDGQAGIPRAGAAPTGLIGPAADAGAANEGAHHTASGSLLAVGGLSSTFDRPASRLSNLAPPALPSPSSRSFTDDHSSRFWSSTQQ